MPKEWETGLCPDCHSPESFVSVPLMLIYKAIVGLES